MKNGNIDEMSLIKLLIISNIFEIVFKKMRIIRANSLLRSRVGRQHGRRGHWPCAVAYAVEGFFLYFLPFKK